MHALRSCASCVNHSASARAVFLADWSARLALDTHTHTHMCSREISPHIFIVRRANSKSVRQRALINSATR